MPSIPVRHISSPAEPATGRFRIRDLKEVTAGHDLVQDRHRHDFFFILVLEKGKGIHEIDFVPYKLIDHSVFILRPGQVHQLELKAVSTGFLVEFDAKFYQPHDAPSQQRWRKAIAKNYCKPDTTRWEKLKNILQSIFDEYGSRQEGWLEMIRAELDIFFIEFTRQSPNPKPVAKNAGSYSQARFEEFAERLEKEISRYKSVADYAGLLHLSPFQLNSITKSIAGKTVSELINEQIILEAKRHLIATTQQVKEIADHLGYEDVSYFIRFFRKQTGYSPEVFRKRFQ